jgi:hypothetical protein
MIAPDTFCDVHSAMICEDGTLNVWLDGADGSLHSLSIPLDECAERATMIEEGPPGDVERLALALVAEFRKCAALPLP